MNIPVEPLPRGIIIAATPLGNVGDASPRLAQALAQADVIAAEDTRRTRSLATALGVEITGRVVSNFDHNEQDRVTQLLDAARTGTVVVVTDAGMPSVSDPGLSLIHISEPTRPLYISYAVFCFKKVVYGCLGSW